MKKALGLLPAIAVLLLLAGCHSKSYRIHGEMEGATETDTLFLITDLENGIPFDTLLIKNGKFEYEGEIDSAVICLLRIKSSTESIQPFFLEPGDITIQLRKGQGESKIKGTQLNDEWQALNDFGFENQNKLQQIMSQFADSLPDNEKQALQSKALAVMQEMTDKYYATAEKNINNELGFMLVTNPTVLNEEQVLVLINKMSAKQHNRKEVKELEKYLKGAAPNEREGQQIPDFKAKSPEGAEINAMSVIAKNEITIIDFWASWCQPCMREMPHMVELYNLYHSKGLGILGVSLDDNREAWKDAIQKSHATWPQISELTRNSEIAQMFGIQAIPHTILVDQEGSILARGLIGTDLENFIRDRLGK